MSNRRQTHPSTKRSPYLSCAISLLATTSILYSQDTGAESGKRSEQSRPVHEDVKPNDSSNDETPQIKHRVLEGFPEHVQNRLAAAQRESLAALESTGAPRPQFLLRLSKRWEPGQKITVAFKGGTKQLHEQIANVAAEWSKHGNIRIDFGLDTAIGQYRTWRTSDQDFAADIRIAFDQTGYYSFVGTDSINRAITRPGEESMNFARFASALPHDWRAVVLHEFGHALGIEHEHQHPEDACDFRFEDDPGYVATTDSFGQFIQDSKKRRPGLYTVLGGPPNRWNRATVDFNLSRLTDGSRAFLTSGDLDPLSIMKYYFDDWMFVAGRKSHCFTDHDNQVLSEKDIQGIAAAYPFTAGRMEEALTERSTALDVLSKSLKPATPLRQHFERLRTQSKAE